MKRTHARLLSLALCAGGLQACAGSGRELRPEQEGLPVALALEGASARYAPTLSALGQAVSEEDNELARGILRNLRGRIEAERALWRRRASSPESVSTAELGSIPGGRALELLDAYERILDGRACWQAARLELRAKRVAESRTVELELWVESDWPTALEFRPGPATLGMQTSTVAADGRQAHHTSSTGITSIEHFHVEPGSATVIPLGRYEVLVPERTLATRDRWTLGLRSGEVIDRERLLPVGPLAATPCHWVERAAFLPSSPIRPAELLEYVETHRGSAVPAVSSAELEAYDRELLRYTAPLMECVVRIEEADREEAIQLLRAEITRATDAEVARLQPALRWLMQTSRPGSDPEHLRRWAREPEGEPESPAGEYEGLDMPSPGSRNRRPR